MVAVYKGDHGRKAIPHQIACHWKIFNVWFPHETTIITQKGERTELNFAEKDAYHYIAPSEKKPSDWGSKA